PTAMKGKTMNENSYVNFGRKPYTDLRPAPKPIIPFFKPDGAYAGMAANDLDYQMRRSAEALEGELAEAGEARVIQLALLGGEPKHSKSWELYADGALAASGSAEFALECFHCSGTRFLEVCREAVAANAAPAFSPREHELLEAVRGIARAEARIAASGE
ncbi:MAG: hypothetical protein IKT43_04240, partial [Clostridia bacterium]|nr:hypothetical protein [Clostridia bacterium]